MARGVHWYLLGSVGLGVLGGLAGCSGGGMFVAREPWRHEAEATCLSAGGVKEGAGKVRITPINGPGTCGADFPFKVSLLGEAAALGFDDDSLRPPSNVPNGAGPSQPRWPIVEQRGMPPPPPYESPDAPRSISPPGERPAPPAMRWTPGPAPAATRSELPARTDAPLSLDPLDPPGTAGSAGAAPEPYDFRKPYGAKAQPARPAASRPPLDPNSPAYDLSQVPHERRRILNEPRTPARADPIGAEIARESARMPPPATPPSEMTRRSERPPPPPPLGPTRGAPVTGALGAVSVSPTATLACPIVSALDQWIAGSVQPAAMRWFGQPVVEIKQISAYSCRGMNGDPRARISEHAFGNALDIAAFTLADGHKITVKGGWKGLPEEQGFLRDVQGAACDQFTTVLAPGSNAYHYDHIHVDLMRRSGARHACNPRAVAGEEVAARARAVYAARRGGEASVTGSIPSRRLASSLKRLPPAAFSDEKSGHILPLAIPGEDGED
jgi:hypothetical protein